ncbi:MAG: DUF2975 domain-containing protein [Coriobacteriales bacterium]|jgi:O-antigen/teichoic acid export membrane protein
MEKEQTQKDTAATEQAAGEHKGMGNRTRAILLQICDILILLLCLFYTLAFLPASIREYQYATPPADHEALELVATWWSPALAIPIVVACIFAWQVFSSIGRGRAFTRENSRRLNGVALCAVIEAPVLLIGGGILSKLTDGDFLLPLLGCVACLVFALAANALAHLTLRAAAIQEENDLTV